MGKTALTIMGEDFYINGQKTYADIATSKASSQGLLMNARFIQGIFDETADIHRFNRFGVDKYDAAANTNLLIAALPEWYSYGLRAITVGFQGGGPCFTIKNETLCNNPFSDDGLTIDSEYLSRMDQIIRAADEIGMIVIVSYFYPGQIGRMTDALSILNAVRTASSFLQDQQYTNVIIEICNEYNFSTAHPIVGQGEGMAVLIQIAREASGGMPVGCSLGGGMFNDQVAKASDVILIHGNCCSRQVFYNLIRQAQTVTPGKPIVCNEDSQAIGNMDVAFALHASWGYYNNLTKQEPPVQWEVLDGEDKFFAYRMAKGIGIELPTLTEADQYYFQGFEPELEYDNMRWIRIASLYPETINYVHFYRDDKLVYTCYDEPFSVNWVCNWRQKAINVKDSKGDWLAEIVLANGQVITRKNRIG